MKKLLMIFAGLLLSTGAAMAAEKTVMHCFAFTPIEGASQSDWDAFYKATDALPGKIKGLERVWAGKLARPLGQFNKAGQQAQRQYGVCMEFQDEAAFKAYGPDPAHKQWVSVYEKVRVPGTTTFQIVGR